MGCAVTHKGLMEIAIAYFAGAADLNQPLCVTGSAHRSGYGLAGQKNGGPLALAAGDERDVYHAGHRHPSLWSGVGDQ